MFEKLFIGLNREKKIQLIIFMVIYPLSLISLFVSFYLLYHDVIFWEGVSFLLSLLGIISLSRITTGAVIMTKKQNIKNIIMCIGIYVSVYIVLSWLDKFLTTESFFVVCRVAIFALYLLSGYSSLKEILKKE